MGARETTVEKYLHKQITDLGGTTRKWVSPGMVGVPDRIIFLNGGIMFVEVKTADGKLSSAQEREHDRLRKHGAAVGVVYGLHGVDKLIEMLKDANS